MFTRKPVAQPVATVAPVVDADPEPPKVGPDGFMSPEYVRWEWRQAERRVEINRQLARIDYTAAQTKAWIAARNERDQAESRYDALRERKALLQRAAGPLRTAEKGYALSDAAQRELAELDAEIGALAPKVASAQEQYETAERRFRQVKDAADADKARRRAAFLEARS